MPFESLAQEGYMHEHPEILGKKGLAEWDKATKGKHLPKHVMKKRTVTMHPTKKGQKPISFNEGGLHASTGTASNKKISSSKHLEAKEGKLGPKAKKQEEFYENVLKHRKFRGKGMGDMGSMKGYDPNLGLPKNQVMNSGYMPKKGPMAPKQIPIRQPNPQATIAIAKRKVQKKMGRIKSSFKL